MSARVFARVSVLRVLHLNGNKLTSFDANSFRGMRFMRRLYFSDNQITRVGRGAFKSVSRYPAYKIYLSDKRYFTIIIFLIITQINPKYSVYFRVGTIDLARNNLTKIEREMFADLRFIDTIDVAENQITEISKDAFKSIYLTKVS